MDSIIEEIKQRLDIVDVISGYIQLQKAGQNYKACCPFHNEKTPSLVVSQSRQIWKCFGCGEGGDIFGFVMKMEGMEFREALRVLASKAGVELKKENIKEKDEKIRIFEICELSSKFYQKYLNETRRGQIAKQYLLGRGFTEKIIEEYRFGYAPQSWDALKRFLLSRKYNLLEIEKSGLVANKNIGGSSYDRFRDRIMFPIISIHGDVVGFSGRVMPDGDEKSAKYINNPQTIIYDKGNLLYGMDIARAHIRRENFGVLVEGNADVVACHQYGFLNTVASCGTAITENQLAIIKRYTDNLFIAFDKDNAGVIATERCIDLALTQGFNVKIIVIPLGKDPADSLKENVEFWKKAIEKARNVMDYFFEQALGKYDSSKIEGKREIANIVLSKVQKINNAIEQHYYIKKLAAEIDIDEKVLFDMRKGFRLKPEKNKQNQKMPIENKNNKVQLLEERLIGFLLIYPEHFSYIKDNFKDDMSFNDKTKAYFEILKGHYAINSEKFDFNKVSSKEDKEKLNMIAFNVENLFTKEDDIKKEIEICLNQLRGNYRKLKMAQLSKELKISEEEKNEEKRTAIFGEIKILIERTKDL